MTGVTLSKVTSLLIKLKYLNTSNNISRINFVERSKNHENLPLFMDILKTMINIGLMKFNRNIKRKTNQIQAKINEQQSHKVAQID